jgi:hypothetical protein
MKDLGRTSRAGRDLEREIEEERRLRRAAIIAAGGFDPDDPEYDGGRGVLAGPAGQEDSAPTARTDEDDDTTARRTENQALWVDLQVRRAMERGDFDDLPGAGKPIRGLGGAHDPDWWVKGLVEREKLTGIAPPAIALRKEDAELEERLDRETTEQGVRSVLQDFNRRVVEARRQLQGGPPVVTPTRDEDAEVAAWRARRAERRERQRRRLEAQRTEQAADDRRAQDGRRGRRTRWWRR